jgi:ERCC4-type nuclease
MNIQIDYREKDLLKECEQLLINYPNTTIESLNLLIGDIRINDLLIERKTLQDLEASIKDGRYTEQSFRLSNALVDGYKVYYFLEGNLENYRGSIPKTTLISTIYSLTSKGFFVIQTGNLKETALFLLQFSEKINKPSLTKTYEESSVTKQKNKNITKDNISLYMLCQIPSISINTATIIMEKYGHINVLIHALRTNPNEIHEFSYLKDDKPKKLNKTVCKNITEYLNY